MTENHDEIFENEWYLVRYSGETPEIALHAALYFLGRAKDGPLLTLSTEQVKRLQDAAMERFGEIMLRDLQHANWGKPQYRGISRSLVNFRRFSTFCDRQGLDDTPLRQRVAEALCLFISREIKEIQNHQRPSIIDCSAQDLNDFLAEVGAQLPPNMESIFAYCRPD